VTNVFLTAFLDKMTSYPLSALPRAATPTEQGGNAFEHAGYVLPPGPLPDSSKSCYYSCSGEGYAARDMYRAGQRFKEMGVEASLRNRYADWLQSVWPNQANPWADLR
jgi:hypothetical protein